MRVIAARYRGQIRSWELWNEPDNPAYWLGTTAPFAELVSAEILSGATLRLLAPSPPRTAATTSPFRHRPRRSLV